MQFVICVHILVISNNGTLQTTGKLFTGHRALYMIGAPGAGIPKPEKLLREWRVFIQSRHHGARHLDPNTLVLYEV